MKAKLKIGQVKINKQNKIAIIENGNLLCFNNGPKTVSELVQGCRGIDGLSKKINEIKKRYGTIKICSENEISDNDIIIQKPINPPEVWAVGVTYQRQAIEHDADVQKRKGKSESLYYYVYESERAEVFFKGFDRTSQGPNEKIYLRADSNQVMPEAELVLVLGENGLPIGYTLGNDLTAWDIEMESPLFLNQAKIWSGSSSVGPFIIPADVLVDPYDIDIQCSILRDNKLIINSIGSTKDLKRSIEELCHFLNFNSPVPSGSLLFTGTACVIPHDFALKDGDKVTVSNSVLGDLENEVSVHSFPKKNYRRR